MAASPIARFAGPSSSQHPSALDHTTLSPPPSTMDKVSSTPSFGSVYKVDASPGDPQRGNGSASESGASTWKRIDTYDLKAKLNAALGSHAQRYWSALLDFMTAKIGRMEFEEEASKCLKQQHSMSRMPGVLLSSVLPLTFSPSLVPTPPVHLHNSLVLGLLFNASADVPGPSSVRNGAAHWHPMRDADGLDCRDEDAAARLLSDAEEDDCVLQPPKKRLRLLAAGLPRKERARIRSIPKSLSSSRSQAAGGSSSLGWAGAGAELLEKKRKEEERRKSVMEKRRAKEAYTEIGSPAWKAAALDGVGEVAIVQDRVALCECRKRLACIHHCAPACRSKHALLVPQRRNRRSSERKRHPFASSRSSCPMWT